MSHLIEGIKLITPPNSLIVLEKRIKLSQGTYQPPSAEGGQFTYCPDAIIPRPPWREATAEDLAILLTTQAQVPASHEQWISLIRVPAEIMSNLMTLQRIANPRQLEEVMETERCQVGLTALKEYFSTFQPLGATMPPLGIGWNYPNLETVTNDKGECLVGLHIDNHKDSPTPAPTASYNRILINLGGDARWFICINLSVKQIYETLSPIEPSLLMESPGRTRLGLMFMKHFPDYPALQLRIQPGEGYIAPTENIIHDGSTLDSTWLDIFVTARSTFTSCPSS